MFSTSTTPLFGNFKLKPLQEMGIIMKLRQIGIDVDLKSGHLFYQDDFKPFPLSFDLIFVRHGETYGNCGQATADGKIDQTCVLENKTDKEKRIFQGQVDSEINQLTENGKKEAVEVAEKLEEIVKSQWKRVPDLILVSPLSRARNTAAPFIDRNKLHHLLKIETNIIEMSFGGWENRRVCDLPPDNAAHRFYQDQNAMVKYSGINGNNAYQKGETFLNVLLRAKKITSYLNSNYPDKKVIMFSHSMFGAAMKILLGHGSCLENQSYLAFDGKNSKGNYYTLPHATPVIFDKNCKIKLRAKL